MSLVTYNGVGLPYPLTTDFSTIPVADDVSQTDWCLTKYVIDVQCLIGPDYLQAIDPNLSAADAPSVMNGIKERLQQRRKRLSFKVNGIEMIPATQEGLPITSAVDASNGPTPTRVKVMDLTNGNFLLQFVVEAHYWNSVDVNANPNGPNRRGNSVLYNRWSETVEIDFKNMAKRTREGKYRIRSDNAEGLIADRFRSLVAAVSVPDGFLRTGSRYRVTPDGLAIEYSVTDEEVFKVPPPPTFRAAGTYVEETSRGGGKRYCEVSLTLEGAKGQDQTRLVNIAMTICLAKLYNNGAFLLGVPPGRGLNPRQHGAVLEGAAVKINLYENKVDMKMRALAGLTRDQINGVEGWRPGMTFTPISDDINNIYTPEYRVFGSSNLLLQAAAYGDPSLRDVILGPGDIVSPADPVVGTGASRVQSTRGRIPGTAGVNPE